MRILTLDNTYYDLNQLPEEVDDMRFAILDNSNPAEPDYHFIPLIFLESFNAPALVLRIGTQTLKMPMDWQILIGEPDIGDLEVLPLTSINGLGKVYPAAANLEPAPAIGINTFIFLFLHGIFFFRSSLLKSSIKSINVLPFNS